MRRVSLGEMGLVTSVSVLEASSIGRERVRPERLWLGVGVEETGSEWKPRVPCVLDGLRRIMEAAQSKAEQMS